MTPVFNQTCTIEIHAPGSFNSAESWETAVTARCTSVGQSRISNLAVGGQESVDRYTLDLPPGDGNRTIRDITGTSAELTKSSKITVRGITYMVSAVREQIGPLSGKLEWLRAELERA